MVGLPNETYMEKYIVNYLTTQPIKDANGNVTDEMEYRQIDQSNYNKDYCIIPSELIAFLKETQPKEYQKILSAKDGNEADVQKSIMERFKSEMARALQPANKGNINSNMKTPQGILTLIKDKEYFDAGCGAKFKLAYFKPANNKTPEHDALYRANRLAIVRQLQYSVKNNNEIDLAVFLNGFPIATLELKNALTGQDHHNAIKQYMTDRPVEGEPLLAFKRCLVHFAVGTEQVFMTTKLDGEKTRFFPFNKTFENRGVYPVSGYRTSYLWEDVLRRDNLMDLIQNFIGVQVTCEKSYNEKKRDFEENISEALIFPRYHQRRAVHKLVNDVLDKGVGHRYLIQHSAGSGKSNTIAWLAFRLSNLYRYASDDNVLFDSVLIVTDRKVLNEQTEKNVLQFQQQDGEVWNISDSKGAKGHTGKDLKDAIEQRKRIIVTTIQKFPQISEDISKYPDRKFAVIIDEAHSSQSGENAREMRKSLSLKEAEEFDKAEEKRLDEEDMLNKKIENEIKRKGNRQNVSFFAFTATPKEKTFELFCERNNGVKEPFDSYTMEEAINEGFILNVLNGYMSFERYYKLVRNEKFADKQYDKKKTIKLLTNYVDLQDTAIERKSRIMLEHFASQTQNELEGKARAMLVTRSRLHAVRYKLKFDNIMQEMHLPYKALVAFSGTVKDSETDCEYTETSMNSLGGNISIPEALKMPKYRILIVANKFQTGFDEPLLQTMFVDKQLGGAGAVQTLSRLNRCKRGKNSTMVLDFVNKPEDIRQAFQDYYNKSKMLEKDETDPNSLYDVKSKLYEFNAFEEADVNEFAKYYFSDTNQENELNLNIAKINNVLDRVCDNAINNFDKDTLDKFRKTCQTFSKLYSFLSQIITFVDVELEKLAPFCLAIAKKLPFVRDNLPYDVLKESELDSYKIKYKGIQNLSLESGDNNMKGMKPGQPTGETGDDYEWLSKIIMVLNDTYGIDLSDDDKVDLQKMKEKVMNNEELMSFFNPANSRDDVKSKFDEEIDSELLNFINTKLELYNKLTNDDANAAFKRIWFDELYDHKVRGIM